MTTPSKSNPPSLDTQTDSPVYLQPDIRRGRVTVILNDSITEALPVSIPELDFTEIVQPGSNSLTIPTFTPWSLESPQLYTLSTETHPAVTFGMREFTIKEKRFFFNNRPLYVKGLDCTALSHNASLSDVQREALKTFLIDIKDTGFNLIRIAVSALTQDLLNIADSIGLLAEVALLKNEDVDSIPSLRNHPSLILWNLLALPEVDAHALSNVDPCRLYLYTETTSGAAHYIRPFRDDHEPIDLHTISHRATMDRLSRSYCEHAGTSSCISYVTHLEVGTQDFSADFAKQCDEDIRARDLSRIVADAEALRTELQALRNASLIARLDGFRSNPDIAGYCITSRNPQSTTVPKLSETLAELASLKSVKVAQDSVRPLIHLQQHNLTPRQESPVRVYFLNESKLEGRADLSLQVVGPTNQVLWKKKRGVRLPKSGKLLWEGSIAASGSPGVHRFIVRVMQNMKRIAESTVDFYVYPEAKKWGGTINLLDPQKRWTPICAERVANFEYKAPIHVIPPIANSIRAYPDNELAQIMGQVQAGAVALIFQPPKDWNDFAKVIDSAITATPTPCNTAFPPQLHYAKMHPVFDALPARCIMGATYADLLPTSTFVESSDEDICGTFCVSSATDSETQWGSDILVVPYGSGRLVFTTMPIMEQLGENPIADHLFINLLNHFLRRSIPSRESSLQIHQGSVEWLRQERQECTQNWALIGMFPHDPDAAKREIYPPEDGIDLNATYPGWYRAISWQLQYPTAGNQYLMDLDDALGLDAQHGGSSEYGIAYAYAEILGDTRGEIRMVPESSHPVEIYLNGALVYSPESEDERPRVYLKLAKNTLLVKFYKQPGAFNFKLNFEEMSTPIRYRWWKPTFLPS